MTLVDESDTDVQDDPAQSNRLRTVLLAVLAVAVLVIAAGGGWLLRGNGEDAASGPSAVDVGFAQDMITHHVQAVTMAGIERDGTTDKSLHILAFDIETGQDFQVGQMAGWLQVWGKGRENADQMAWMGHDHMAMGAGGLMPGMATPAQMNALGAATGKARDILFLQLMIHHHQGGLPMAQYALEHGSSQSVRDLAQSIVNAQSSEIIQMEQMLRGLGGRPLAPPT